MKPEKKNGLEVMRKSGKLGSEVSTQVRLANLTIHLYELPVDLDVPSITKSIVNHVQTSLAREAYNLDDQGAYQAAASSVRDNMLVCMEIGTIFRVSDTIVAQMECYPKHLHPQGS
jgi:hypothetical protein